MIRKNKNGFVIEMVLIFMLITFGFCMAITGLLGSLSAQRKLAKNNIQMQTDLNQLGEYYLRCVEAGGEFPKGTESNYASFDWMDDEAREFFKKCEKYHFRYNSYYSIERAGANKFFKEKYIWRKLVISTDGINKMVIELKETKLNETNKNEYFVQQWAVGDNLITDIEKDGYKKDSLTVLQKLWRFIGSEIDTFDKLRKNEDWLQFFQDNFNNVEQIFSDD